MSNTPPLNHGSKSKPRKILLGKRPSESGSARPGPASKRRAATPHPERDHVSNPGPMSRNNENVGGQREDARARDFTERIPEASLADSSDEEVPEVNI